MKKVLSIFVTFCIILSIYIPVSSAIRKTTVIYQPGSNIIKLNNKNIKAEKPYTKNNSIYIPVKVFIEAFGGNLTQIDKYKYLVSLIDTDILLKAGEKRYTANELEEELTSPVADINGTLMVPVEVFTDNYFNIKNSFNKKSKQYSLTLTEDTSPNEFSGLFKNITRLRAGNSYYGWSIIIPRKSQLMYCSEDSSRVSVENMIREVFVDVSVVKDDGTDIKKRLEKEKSSSIHEGSADIYKVKDTFINQNANPVYGEITGTSLRGDSIERVIIANGYVYYYSISYNKENCLSEMKENYFFESILDTFKLGFKGKDDSVEDFSTINKNGLIKYTDEDDGFSLDILPDWDDMSVTSSSLDLRDMYSTVIGQGNNEYISITPNKVLAGVKFDLYKDAILKKQKDKYNPELYKLIKDESTTLSSYKAYRIVYSLQLGNQVYIHDENYILVDNIVFKVLINSLEQEYKAKSVLYEKILNSIKFDKESLNDYKLSLDSLEELNLSSDNNLYEIRNKAQTWAIKVPGYWKHIPGSLGYESFCAPEGEALIIVGSEITALKSSNSGILNLPDLEEATENETTKDNPYKFSLVKTETLVDKGTDINIYTYRYNISDSGEAGYIKYYVFESGEYSYYFLYMLNDIYASDSNIKELQDIWTSFTPLKL